MCCCRSQHPPTPGSILRRTVLTALGMRLDGDKVTAMVDPLTALLQVGLPEGPQLQPKPHRKWHRGESTRASDSNQVFWICSRSATVCRSSTQACLASKEICRLIQANSDQTEKQDVLGH